MSDAVNPLKSADGMSEVVGLTPPAGSNAWAVSTYRFRCEAYNSGTLVANHAWSTMAENDQQAGIFANNHLAVWGQQLKASHINYNRLSAVFLGKS